MSLSLKQISKRFDDKWVLRDVSFEANPGEILGIFGESSAGKSTLIEIAAGKLAPTAGSIEYNGRDITNLSCADRKFQFPSLSNQSIWRALFRSNTASELSDGEGQMLALETALKTASGVLLLDNSFCDMDKSMRGTAFARLREIVAARELTVICASNDFEEILLACDRVAVLTGGEIAQIGKPQHVYENPESSSVASIVERNNLFAARRLTSSKSEMPEYQTLDGSHRLFAQKHERTTLAPINQNVILGIRPEQISLSFGASFPEDNLLKATVTSITFLGATTVVGFDCDGLSLTALVLKVIGLNIGDECMVSLPPERIQIFNQ